MPYKEPKIPNFEIMTAPLRKAFPKAFRMIRSFAGEELRAFIARIKLQAFPSFDATPLSDAWMAEKIRLHLDTRTMISTHSYIRQIRVFVKQDSETEATVFIGFDEDDVAVDPHTKLKTKFKLHVLASVQENGSMHANVPPRPHWRLQRLLIERHAVDLRKKIADSIVK